MRITQGIVSSRREILSTQCGAPSNCSSWSKGRLLTCSTLKWCMVKTHIKLSGFFRLRWVWVSPARLLTWWCCKQEWFRDLTFFALPHHWIKFYSLITEKHSSAYTCCCLISGRSRPWARGWGRGVAFVLLVPWLFSFFIWNKGGRAGSLP